MPLTTIPNPQSAIRRALVLSFDHFHIGYLGCYGNDWIETPNFDRLAGESVVFDRHFCENLDPAALGHAWWTGRYQFLLDETAQRKCAQVAEVLSEAGVRTRLVVESDGRDDPMIAPSFDDNETIRGKDGLEIPESETPVARLIQRSCELLAESAEAPELLWIKSRGVPSPWLPPRGFADLYLEDFGLAAEKAAEEGQDEGDAPEEESERPSASPQETPSEAPSPDSPEADESLEWRYAAAMYAAYVTLVDRWFGKLAAALAESPGWRDALLIVCAGSGQPLGEHGRIADERWLLRAECVQAPLWVRLPQGEQRATRRRAIVQTVDLAPTLLDWFGAVRNPAVSPSSTATLTGESLLPLVRNERQLLREAALMGFGRQERGILTDDFFYVESDEGEGATSPAPLLFEKPQDRWDQCDVLSQYAQDADELSQRLREAVT